MPLYSYLCDCGLAFEEFAEADRCNDVLCPRCKRMARQNYKAKLRGVAIKQDTLPWGPQQIVSVEGEPWVDSFSGMKRAMQHHDEVHGTKLVRET
jgi:hypothetical protein